MSFLEQSYISISVLKYMNRCQLLKSTFPLLYLISLVKSVPSYLFPAVKEATLPFVAPILGTSGTDTANCIVVFFVVVVEVVVVVVAVIVVVVIVVDEDAPVEEEDSAADVTIDDTEDATLCEEPSSVCGVVTGTRSSNR
jgi:hypothetical protein